MWASRALEFSLRGLGLNPCLRSATRFLSCFRQIRAVDSTPPPPGFKFGDYLLALPMTPSSQDVGSPKNPGRFSHAYSNIAFFAPRRAPRSGTTSRSRSEVKRSAVVRHIRERRGVAPWKHRPCGSREVIALEFKAREKDHRNTVRSERVEESKLIPCEGVSRLRKNKMAGDFRFLELLPSETELGNLFLTDTAPSSLQLSGRREIRACQQPG